MPIVPLADLPEVKPEKTRDPSLPAVPSVYVESDVDMEIERAAIAVGSDLRKRGYRLFLSGSTPEKISEELTASGGPAIDVHTVVVWAREGGWAARMKARNDAKEILVRENVRRIRLNKAEDEAESSLRIGKRIREVVEKKLEDPDELTPMGLMNVANAAKASGDLGAHGMGESASSASEDKAAKGKTPLVMIFPGGGLPPRMPGGGKCVTIDMEEPE